MFAVPLPPPLVPIAPAPHVQEVPPDPDVAAVAPFVVSADPDVPGPIARMLHHRGRRRLARAMDRRRLAPLRLGHRG